MRKPFCDQPGCLYCREDMIPCLPGECGRCDDRFWELHLPKGGAK